MDAMGGGTPKRKPKVAAANGHDSDFKKTISPDPAVADFLSVFTLANLEIKPERRLLGDFITSSSRAFLVGSTGIGKTMLIYGMVGGMASGNGFLHWSCDGPSKWLIIDGEMPKVLLKSRSADMLRRGASKLIPPHGVTIYAREREDDFAKAFPHLGRMPALNTEAGLSFVIDLITAIGGVDGVALDNVMSLAPGDQKDEMTWAGCIPLVEYLSRNGIAQIWGDHTGHNSIRQYGSSTKSWRMDAVAVITPLTEDQAPSADHLAFKMSFESPGKARRRTPDNWHDFEACTIRLRGDRWTSEVTGRATGKATAKISPQCRQFHRSLIDALAITHTPGRTSRSAWLSECIRTGLVEADATGDTVAARRSKGAKFRKYLSELRAVGMIGIDGETVSDLSNGASSFA